MRLLFVASIATRFHPAVTDSTDSRISGISRRQWRTLPCNAICVSMPDSGHGHLIALHFLVVGTDGNRFSGCRSEVSNGRAAMDQDGQGRTIAACHGQFEAPIRPLRVVPSSGERAEFSGRQRASAVQTTGAQQRPVQPQDQSMNQARLLLPV